MGRRRTRCVDTQVFDNSGSMPYRHRVPFRSTHAGGVGPNSNVSRLFWSDGNTRHYVEGFVFDGTGTCAVGFDHDANSPGTQYESFNTHRNMLFTGFTVAGVRVGVHQPPHGSAIASAEQQFTNCIFAYNFAGLACK